MLVARHHGATAATATTLLVLTDGVVAVAECVGVIVGVVVVVVVGVVAGSTLGM